MSVLCHFYFINFDIIKINMNMLMRVYKHSFGFLFAKEFAVS